MAKVFDNGDVSSQAPVHTAALVTNQHTSADRCPARVLLVSREEAVQSPQESAGQGEPEAPLTTWPMS